MDEGISRIHIPMKDGRTLAIFVNVDNGCVVLDALNKKCDGGNEFVRENFYKIKPYKPKR